MLDAALAWLGDSQLAILLRGSFWLYPIVNSAHILGIALLVGGIVPLDLRLLGLWRRVPLAQLAAVLVPSAGAGVLLVVVTGPAMFLVQPQDYAGNPYFQVKLPVVAAAIANALLLRRVRGWRDGAGAGRLRAAAVLSIGLWLAAIFCGRMIAFY
jgi:hypothetical protein